MGQQAGQMLLERIERPDSPGQVKLLPPQLEARGSTGPVPTR
jgi:DNA-binding LacI/PurR family transcriptional regulator